MKKIILPVALGLTFVIANSISAADNGPGTFFTPAAGTSNVTTPAPTNQKAKIHRTVAFLGGSITEMPGFRPRTMKALRAKYPDVAFREIAAGLSSTCSDAGAFRLEEDILAHGLPDLFIVEAAVNDDQDGHFDRRRCIRGLEGSIRHILTANPSCAIVVGLMVNHAQYQQLLKGKTPIPYAAGADVARHYGAALADIGSALAKSAQSGGISWKEYRDCHPSPIGCDFGTCIVTAAIEKVFNPYKNPVARQLPSPLDEGSYFGGHALPFSTISTGKDWHVSTPKWSSIPGNKRGYFTHSDILWTETPHAEIEIKFNGVGLATFLTAGPDAANMEVSIDNAPFKLFKLKAFYGKLHYPYVEILAEDLTPGNHVARIRAIEAPHKNGTSGNALRIHRLFVNKR